MARHGTSFDAYGRLVGVNVLGETFPGLNSHGDSKKEILRFGLLNNPTFKGLRLVQAGIAEMTSSNATLLIGLNRRGTVRLQLPVETTGTVTLRWNDSLSTSREIAGHQTIDVTVDDIQRGVNTLFITAPVGTKLRELTLFAVP